MEKLESVDQKLAALTRWIESQPEIFSRQGAVVSTWRMYRGQKRGPYFQLKFRAEGRQDSVYLGRAQKLATGVQDVLKALQAPRRARRRDALAHDRLRAGLRQVKKAWGQELAQHGLQLKGFEVRGWRKLPVAANA